MNPYGRMAKIIDEEVVAAPSKALVAFLVLIAMVIFTLIAFAFVCAVLYEWWPPAPWLFTLGLTYFGYRKVTK